MKYFNNKTWSEISREERFFCAELFFELKSNPNPFLSLIGKGAKDYEIAYEVCFYRDVLHAYKRSIKGTNLPQKRTFDLALFSEDEIIIVEAKAAQGFDNKQLDSFNMDIANIESLFQLIECNTPKICLIAIYSSKYSPKAETVTNFQIAVTWKELSECYPTKNELFLSADNTYQKLIS